MASNPELRNRVTIYLEDRSDEAVVEAMEIIYNHYRDIVYSAEPDSHPVGNRDYPTGDINWDMDVDFKDASALVKYIAGWDVIDMIYNYIPVPQY